MSRQKKSLVGKIGYCDNTVLGILGRDGKPLKGGHYVYIREMNDANSCNVNVITSLEDKNQWYQMEKLHKVKRGMLYPVPKGDADFSRWSAINLAGNINDIKIADIKNIDQKRMKQRHKWYVGKFTKKK